MAFDNDRGPDNEEKIIRLVCGALLGFVVGFVVAVHLGFTTFSPIVLIVIATVLICGYLALRHGDRFWHSFFSTWW